MAATLVRGEIVLAPLVAEDAHELAPLLADPELHRFIGGAPLAPAELLRRYERLQAGAPAGSRQTWLNWVIRRRADGQALGTAQATVSGRTAEIAWVVARRWQRRGYAGTAASALVELLGDQHGLRVVANIHPAHIASQRVAARAGLRLTTEETAGERVWASTTIGS